MENEVKDKKNENMDNLDMEKDNIAIEVKDLRIGYKNIKAYSIKKNLLKLKKVHVDEFQAVKGVLLVRMEAASLRC